MESLIVENVRCFRKRQEVPLAPLTLLVGENSTGKSTFLALVRLASDLAAGKAPLDFNEEPFLLGAFSQIASSKRGRSAQAKSFVLGASYSLTELDPNASYAARVSGEFKATNGQPSLSRLTVASEGHLVHADVRLNGTISRVVLPRAGDTDLVLLDETNAPVGQRAGL